jgi:hypothetical protein
VRLLKSLIKSRAFQHAFFHVPDVSHAMLHVEVFEEKNNYKYIRDVKQFRK